jgi:hypothetical protein
LTVEYAADQEYEGGEIDPDHQGDGRIYGAVDRLIVGKLINEKDEGISQDLKQ